MLRVIVGAFVFFWVAGVSAAEERYDREKLVADLRQFVDTVLSTHPDMSYSADVGEIRRVASEIEAELRTPMTVREAWIKFARLNPVFRDAHVGVVYPAAAFQAYREAGGAVFPLAVRIDDVGKLRVAETRSTIAGVMANDEVVSINGEPMVAFLTRVMPLMRGETQKIRYLVLVRNFAAYWWTLNGSSKRYEVGLRGRDGRISTVPLPVTSEVPVPDASAYAFRFRYLSPDIGYLEVRSFDPSLLESFRTFVRETFAVLKERNTSKLVVDVRANPGGAHDLSDILLDHLTPLRTRQASSLRARIIEQNKSIAPGARIGDVVTLDYDEWREPTSNMNRFSGATVLLIGPRTYSQGIVFGATFQDFRVGVVAGQATDGWANQTGQVHMMPLTHTALSVAAPLYIIYRANGDQRPGGLQPDRLVAEDPNDPMVAVNSAAALLN